MLALKRTDERLAVGKKISPFFLFGTLLWPKVLRRWRYNEETRGVPRLAALHEASVEVLETECQKISIQRRFQADMHDLWLMQARLERRTGKTPYAIVRHPRYRAGYDFLLLRSQVGEVPAWLPEWWDAFANADEETRADMIREAQAEARRTADEARRGRAAAESGDELPEASEGTERRRRRRPRRRSRRPQGAAGSES